MTQTELPDTIALFPLPGALLLPRAKLPLHVFEPRYLAMVDDVLKTRERLIGIIQPRPAPKGQRRLATIGCAGRVVSFTETDDNRYMIVLAGISRFDLKDEVPGFTPYLRADVDWTRFDRDARPAQTDGGFDRAHFMVLLKRFFAAKELATDWDSMNEAEDEALINSLSMLCPFEAADKQALLEAPTLADRRETLQMLMEFSLRADGEGKMQ
jgi:uncharacterized protein